MSWISTHPRLWRAGLLALLVLALIGPWTLDIIIVPEEYPCSPPIIRLEGNRCGAPLSGTWLLWEVSSSLIHTSVNFLSGSVVVSDWARELFIGLCFLIVILPLVSTVLLITGGVHGPRRAFQFAAWGLVVGLGFWLIVANYPQLPWALWGLWLYIVTAVLMLTLEAVTFMQERISRRAA